MLRIKKQALDKALWSLYAFVLIFAPPFMPYPQIALTALSLFLLVGFYPKTSISVIVQSNMHKWAIGMLVWAAYILTIPTLISMVTDDIVDLSHYMHIFNRYGMLFLVGIPCCTLVISHMEKKRYDWRFLVEIMINAGLIEAGCAIAAFLSPAIKNFFVSLMRTFTGNYLYSNAWYTTVRSYGFAGTLVDLFGYGVALIAGVSLYYGIVGKAKYILYSQIIIIAALLNARTGVILYVCAFLLACVYVLKDHRPKQLLRLLLTMAELGLCVFIVFRVLARNEATMSWIKNAINSFTGIFSKSKAKTDASTNVFNLLLETQSWSLPSPIRVVFGTGHNLYLAEGYRHSDIGYINEIWLCGIVGCLLLYGLIVWLTMKIVKKKNSVFSFAGIYMMLSYFAFNIKGIALGYNPGAITMFLMLFGFLYSKNAHSTNLRTIRSNNDA